MEHFYIDYKTLTRYTGVHATEVVVPDGVTKIMECAFYGCRRMQRITLPASVTEVGRNAFQACDRLRCVTILGVIDYYSLCEIKSLSLREIIAPNIEFTTWKNMEMIIPACAGYLKEPEKFSSPQKVAEYEKYLASQRKKILQYFWEADDLAAVLYYAGKGKITAKNFEDDYLNPAQEANATDCVAWLLNWKNENISSEMQEKQWEREMNKDPFNAADMKKIWKYSTGKDGAVRIDGYKGLDTAKIFIPERIGKRSVTAIGDAFSSCINLQAVSIPEGVTIIGERAFEHCENLQKITIPQSVTAIGVAAFSRCSGLRSITLPKGVTVIKNQAFSRCEKLQSVEIPESVTTIGERAFEYCENLQSVRIHKKVTAIEDYAFCGCKNLCLITIPEGVHRIGKRAFSGCSELLGITIPKGVTQINEHAFYECRKLKSVTLSEGVKIIDDSAFAWCSNLHSIKIPKSVTQIRRKAFLMCKNLTIHAPAGSYAETYAKENNIPFVAD